MKNKKQRATHSVWGHHDTMIVNLRDWVSRELHTLQLDVAKEAPHLEDDPNIVRLFKSAEDMNGQLFDLIRGIVERAEIEASKVKRATMKQEPDESYEFEELGT